MRVSVPSVWEKSVREIIPHIKIFKRENNQTIFNCTKKTLEKIKEGLKEKGLPIDNTINFTGR